MNRRKFIGISLAAPLVGFIPSILLPAQGGIVKNPFVVWDHRKVYFPKIQSPDELTAIDFLRSIPNDYEFDEVSWERFLDKKDISLRTEWDDNELTMFEITATNKNGFGMI